ncbi:response regulator transcription factor [Bacteriovorax sp. PP10]|uniref:Response regulator transcription factor n=1 Tax=Bacteriovorax antarcticus TaxID=3088717 RepID=A0ABU5VZY4_9BACT|nr:response regulator transcription factor [Bacteriovorax sp. PP10]MEA9358142.1 response regulator transcription factor [Bacteriovorax sp. PP10]
MPRILIVDDSKNQLTYLEGILMSDFDVSLASNVLKALKFIETIKIDLLILDIHMPVISGIDFLRQSKEVGRVLPKTIIFSADNDLNTRISSLELGVVDFLNTQMTSKEIFLRVRNQVQHIQDNIISYKNIKMNTSTMDIFIADKKVDFTLIEFKIFRVLMDSPDALIEREVLIEKVWGNDIVVLNKTLTTHLANLRPKILFGGIDIKSVKNEGVMLKTIE